VTRRALLALALALSACSREPERQEPTAAPSAEEPAAAEEQESGIAPLERQTVTVYYPAAVGDGLIGEPHEIFATSSAGDRAKQIVADLISGPTSDRAFRALPPGTLLRQVFVLEDGTSYVDLSSDVLHGLGGGSTGELLAVYALIDSLVLNVPEIRRVGILVDGREIESLNGHLDLRRPLPADRSLILGAEPQVVQRDGTGGALGG
jgi:spore germination protein GerM